jgi:peptidoglycan/xylan/chitin deacetylase (PgdA/CDA1 family)
MNHRILIFVLWMSALVAGCGVNVFAAPVPTATQTSAPLSPTETSTALPTFAVIPDTATPSPTPTPTWVVQGPDHVLVPILMYHHIAVSPVDSIYYVPPDRFEDEIRLLHDWNYTPITTSMLVDAITKGASLPPRPVIITFDDANEDNYTNAFPIMKKYGFTGVLYLVVQYLNQPNYLTVAQVKEMIAAGWEIGSHSETHNPLPNMDLSNLRYEILQSRKDLQNMFGVPVLTFAYPFGYAGSAAADYVHYAGYIAAMGANGFAANQGLGNLFMLQRSEIRGTEDAKTFIRFLPWLGDSSFLPTDTPTPTTTPSRTPIPTWTMYPTSTSWKTAETPAP